MQCEGAWVGDTCNNEATHAIYDPEIVEQYGEDEKTFVCEVHLQKRRKGYSIKDEDRVEKL